MKVELLHNTPLHIASTAIRTCWQSQDKSDSLPIDVYPYGIECGPNDKALIDRVGNKNKHSSTLEHLTYTFYISGVSRALLQELARHRMASPSVKSTRYTLKELKSEAPFKFIDGALTIKKRAAKYLVFTDNRDIDAYSVLALENVRKLLVSGYANDFVKYALPESYKTELTWTINARSLQNFIALRTSKAALWEIRELANAIYEELPEDHKYLFINSISKE